MVAEQGAALMIDDLERGQRAAFVAGLPDVRRAITQVPGWPAIATAATIAAKLLGLMQIGQGGGYQGQRQSMLALGQFVFGLDSLAFQELQRRTDWRHAGTERFGAAPAFQFLGPGADTISLPGILVPEFAGKNASLRELRDMADTGDAYPLVEFEGRVMGQFVIRAVDERRSVFLPGGVAKRIEFGIELEKVE